MAAPAKQLADDRRQLRDLAVALRAAGQVAHPHLALAQLLEADEHGEAGAEARRLLELPLDAAAGQVELGARQALAAQALGERERLAARLVGEAHHVHRRPRPGGGRAAPGEGDALEAAAEAAPRRRRSAELLDEPVVAAAAADGVLRRLEGERLELERRARVVVEPAHETGVDVGLEADGAQQAQHALEVLATVRAQVVDQARRAAVTARQPSSLQSKVRSGLSSMRTRQSSQSSSSCACR